jgi:two-component system response regulator
MRPNNEPVNILVAEDDPDDRLLIEDAFREARVSNPITFVNDGVELMEYLQRKGQFTDQSDGFMPGLILLDLNMPRMDGREALKEIKADPNLKRIPVIALTTSKEEEDIFRTYDLGASSFISKPVSFDELVKTLSGVTEYWVQIVHLPQK